MNKPKQMVASLNSLRYVLALCVVLGHIFILCFWNGNPRTVLGLQNLAVDGFFILSGFLLAKSCLKNNPETDEEQQNAFFALTQKRIKRLWPEFMFATVFTLALAALFHMHVKQHDLLFNMVFLAQINNIPGIINGSWYISVLFYVGLFYSFLLIRSRKYRFIVTAGAVFFSLSYLYAHFGNLSLNAFPLIGGFLSAGFIKGIMDIGLGILLFQFAAFIHTNPLSVKQKYLPTVFIVLECLGIFLTVYAMVHAKINQNDFLALFGFSILIPQLYYRKETILKFLSFKFWDAFSDSAYMLFLTHVVLVEVIKSKWTLPRAPQTYLALILFCTVCAKILYILQKKVSAGFGKILCDKDTAAQ